MKKKSARLKKIVAIAKAEERRQAELTGRAQSRLDGERHRFGELNAYRHDYATGAGGRGSVSSAHWKDYHRFLARLDGAIRSQRQVIHDCEQSVETHRRHWVEKRRRLESLQRVVGRYADEERSHEERLEQRRLDDLPAAPDAYETDG